MKVVSEKWYGFSVKNAASSLETSVPLIHRVSGIYEAMMYLRFMMVKEP